MTETPDRTPQSTDVRQARLRDALRENLKRRKLQARGRAGQVLGPDGHAEIVQDADFKEADDAT
jgi:hypothetical protein